MNICKNSFLNLRSVVLFVSALLSTGLLAQDPAGWYKKWKDPANNDSVRLSGLELLTFEFAYSNPDSALKLAEIEKKEAIQFKLPFFYASAFYNKAVAYKSKGDIIKGIENARLAIVEFTKVNDEQRVANSYNILGSLFDLQGDIERCIESYLTSVKIKEKIGDKTGMANSYNNIGNIISRTSDLNRAISYYEKSIALRKETKDDMGLAKGLNNLGSVLILKGEYIKALELFRTSIDLRKRAGKEKSVLNVLGNMGEVFLKLNMMDSSLYYYQNYLKMAQKQSEVKTELTAMTNLAHVLILNKKLAEAEKLLMEASKKIEGKNLMDARQNLYERMYELYEQTKKYDLALKYHVKYVTIRDSVYSDEKNSNVIQQQMRFEFEKKEAETKMEQARKDGEVKAKIDGQKKIIIMIISAGSLVLLLLLLAILAYRNSKKANKKIEKQNEVILYQKHLVEEKQKEILDSINYAKRIQYTLLAHADFLKEHLPKHFVYFKPKDIVSGDFYWATSIGSGNNEKFYLAVCDSTGHGVPGAFMSLLNISFLGEAINEKNIHSPDKVFDFVKQRLVDNISKEGQKDGFDGILLCWNKALNKITYASANNSPVLIRNGEIVELGSDRMPVGKSDRTESFTLYEFAIQTNDMLYLYTDGYADQFGGPKGKKFMYKRMNAMLQEIAQIDLFDQEKMISNTFDEWKGSLEQIDDVCIIGIRF